jgi:hypothetical protein
MKKCPSCALIIHNDTRACDCGYNFSEETKQIGKIKSDLEKANGYIKIAWTAGYLYGGIIMVLSFSNPTMRVGYFIGALIFLGLSFGIYKKSRVCAILLFSLLILPTIIGIIYGIVERSWTLLIPAVVPIFLSYPLYKGIKGTYAYHKLVNEKP